MDTSNSGRVEADTARRHLKKVSPETDAPPSAPTLDLPLNVGGPYVSDTAATPEEWSQEHEENHSKDPSTAFHREKADIEIVGHVPSQRLLRYLKAESQERRLAMNGF